MATVTRENIGVLNEKIVVKVEKDDYLPSFQKAIKDYSKKANIPGFRKGMVPVGMVKKMYGSSVFADEVIKSVEKGLSDYMTNEKLQIFAQPLPLPENDSRKLDMDQPDEYQFSFEVGLKPAFTLVDLAGAHLTLYKVDVTDETVNSEVEKLQERAGKMIDQETITTAENDLNLTFIETDAEGNEVEGGIRKETSLNVSNFTPEMQTELMGKKKDDTLVLQLSKSIDEKDKQSVLHELELTPEDGEKYFKIIIDIVHLIEKTPLTEAFFKQVYPDKEITTEEDFKSALRKEIEKQWEGSSRNQLQDQIYHELLHTHIEFPEEFLKRWMLTGTDKQKSPDEVEAEYPAFADQLKWTLITDKIVADNSIDVKPADLREFAKAQLLGYMGGSNININQPWVNDYVERMMKDKKFVEDSYHRVQIEKIFSWAETQVHPTEATISEGDFTKMLQEHKHEH
jgi:trigger factor